MLINVTGIVLNEEWHRKKEKEVILVFLGINSSQYSPLPVN